MSFLFKAGGWFFLVMGILLMISNYDAIEDMFVGEAGDGISGIIPFVIGFGQALIGLIFVRLSNFMGKGGIKDGLLEREKLEQRILEMESRGIDTTKYKALLDKLDSKKESKDGNT